jgi:hypothetical protein
MLPISPRNTALALSLVLLVGCTGGTGSARLVQPTCRTDDGLGFCLVSCNLGCTAAGCSVTEIAQNQPIIFSFNQDVDPASVTSASLSFRTASGEEPVGEFIVQGSTVTFVPEIRVVGGASFFGFKASETYTLTMPAGGNQINALRSTAGDRLVLPLLCRLSVTRGVIDLDGRPPSARLSAPTKLRSTPRNTTVVVEFSELIDVSAFQTSDPGRAPVLVRVRKTRPSGGGFECDPAAQGFVVPGGWRTANDSVRQVTVATFTPLADLPSLGCVEALVTDNVRDLSGKQASPQLFSFITDDFVGPESRFTEDFQSNLNLDLDTSSGDWGGGKAVPGLVGWDGLHGPFDIRFGKQTAVGVYEWDTDNLLIPPSNTLSGQPETVTDGVFRFSTLYVPKGLTVRFIGTKPPRVYVRGSVLVEGKIEVNGVSAPTHAGTLDDGQAAVLARAFAGDSGKGGDKNRTGTGPDPKHNGSPGRDVKLVGGHAYAGRAPGTGGRASNEFPPSGLRANVRISPFGFSMMIAAGGGGGGHAAAGSPGRVVRTFFNDPNDEGPPSPGGIAFDPFPKPAAATVFDHFLIGGSGGGGGGSHPHGSLATDIRWQSGAAGGSGAGPLGLRIGRDLTMLPGSAMQTIGGNGGSGVRPDFEYPAPGGGGSGASMILQIEGRTSMNGILEFAGGVGGVSKNAGASMETVGGDGAPGYLRFERPGTPVPGDVGLTRPTATAANVAPLQETDQVVGSASKWRSTNLVFPPTYMRYAIIATVNGNRVMYSDDPAYVDPDGAPNVGLADVGQAVRFRAQGADVNAQGIVTDPLSVRPWRRLVGFSASEQGLNSDGRTGFRFLLLFDRSVGNAVVEKVTLFYKN